MCSECEPGKCHLNTTLCEPAPGGVCFAMKTNDVSGKHWKLWRGCRTECLEHDISDSHRIECCNNTDKCNEKLLGKYAYRYIYIYIDGETHNMFV